MTYPRDAHYIEVKVPAHRALNLAVKRGEVTRPVACEACGKAPKKTLNGHHDDYTKPLSVRWLCERCHSAAHAGEPRSRWRQFEPVEPGEAAA